MEELDLNSKVQRLAPPSFASANGEVDSKDIELQKEFAKIPDKLAFKIGEVSKIIGVKSYVLRYWETEFDQLKPQKSRHNQRVFSKKDVETVMMIKHLLYKDRFSIEGARSALRSLKKDVKKTSVLTGTAAQIEELRDRAHDLVLAISSVKERFKPEL